MYFLASEYTTIGGRIDTFAVDSSGAPIIIEYKKTKDDNIINQGLSYLRWLKAQKQEFFEMMLLKNLGPDIAKKIQIDWKNPRVICIAESYNKFDIDTVEVIPMRIELYRFRYYEDNIFSLEPININEQKEETKLKSEKSDSMNFLDTLLLKANYDIKSLYVELRDRIKELDENIEEKTTSLYVAFRMSMTFTEIHIGKNQLKLYLRPIEYKDPRKIVEKIPDSYNWTLDRRIYVKSLYDIDYAMSLIEQSYQDVL